MPQKKNENVANIFKKERFIKNLLIVFHNFQHEEQQSALLMHS